MNHNWQQRVLSKNSTVKQALAVLDAIGVASNVLFVVNDDMLLMGSVTDGDIRRGLLNDVLISEPITRVMNADCRKVTEGEISSRFIASCRQKGINYVPIVSTSNKIIDIISISEYREVIEVDAVIMAGGKGERLLPLTRETPKPMLHIAGKPIIEHNIDRLKKFGVRNFHLSINYLGHVIRNYFNDGSEKGVNVFYVEETAPLGTIGAVSLIESLSRDVVLIMNSDLLTNIDYGDFYKEFIDSGADMAVATIPHMIDLPYAILELEDSTVKSLKEKPKYTYFANAGIYLVKKKMLDYIPKGGFYNATDLMEKLLEEKRKVFHYPILGYWLDIRRMSDFLKAQEDFKHINF